MGRKLGLKGFSDFRIFPVIENSANAYTVGDGIPLPEVQEMTRDNDTTEQKVYADDTLYMNIKNFNGINATITVAELGLELRAVLGDGVYNDETGEFKWTPDAEKPVLGCTYKVPMAGGGARLYRLYAFQVEEIRDASHKTAGEGLELQSCQIMGTFVKRKIDDSPGAFKDVSSLNDLSYIESIDGV